MVGMPARRVSPGDARGQSSAGASWLAATLITFAAPRSPPGRVTPAKRAVSLGLVY